MGCETIERFVNEHWGDNDFYHQGKDGLLFTKKGMDEFMKTVDDVMHENQNKSRLEHHFGQGFFKSFYKKGSSKMYSHDLFGFRKKIEKMSKNLLEVKVNGVEDKSYKIVDQKVRLIDEGTRRMNWDSVNEFRQIVEGMHSFGFRGQHRIATALIKKQFNVEGQDKEWIGKVLEKDGDSFYRFRKGINEENLKQLIPNDPAKVAIMQNHLLACRNDSFVKFISVPKPSSLQLTTREIMDLLKSFVGLSGTNTEIDTRMAAEGLPVVPLPSELPTLKQAPVIVVKDKVAQRNKVVLASFRLMFEGSSVLSHIPLSKTTDPTQLSLSEVQDYLEGVMDLLELKNGTGNQRDLKDKQKKYPSFYSECQAIIDSGGPSFIAEYEKVLNFNKKIIEQSKGAITDADNYIPNRIPLSMISEGSDPADETKQIRRLGNGLIQWVGSTKANRAVNVQPNTGWIKDDGKDKVDYFQLRKEFKFMDRQLAEISTQVKKHSVFITQEILRLARTRKEGGRSQAILITILSLMDDNLKGEPDYVEYVKQFGGLANNDAVVLGKADIPDKSKLNIDYEKFYKQLSAKEQEALDLIIPKELSAEEKRVMFGDLEHHDFAEKISKIDNQELINSIKEKLKRFEWLELLRPTNLFSEKEEVFFMKNGLSAKSEQSDPVGQSISQKMNQDMITMWTLMNADIEKKFEQGLVSSAQNQKENSATSNVLGTTIDNMGNVSAWSRKITPKTYIETPISEFGKIKDMVTLMTEIYRYGLEEFTDRFLKMEMSDPKNVGKTLDRVTLMTDPALHKKYLAFIKDMMELDINVENDKPINHAMFMKLALRDVYNQMRTSDSKSNRKLTRLFSDRWKISKIQKTFEARWKVLSDSASEETKIQSETQNITKTIGADAKGMEANMRDQQPEFLLKELSFQLFLPEWAHSLRKVFNGRENNKFKLAKQILQKSLYIKYPLFFQYLIPDIDKQSRQIDSTEVVTKTPRIKGSWSDQIKLKPINVSLADNPENKKISLEAQVKQVVEDVYKYGKDPNVTIDNKAYNLNDNTNVGMLNQELKNASSDVRLMIFKDKHCILARVKDPKVKTKKEGSDVRMIEITDILYKTAMDFLGAVYTGKGTQLGTEPAYEMLFMEKSINDYVTELIHYGTGASDRRGMLAKVVLDELGVTKANWENPDIKFKVVDALKESIEAHERGHVAQFNDFVKGLGYEKPLQGIDQTISEKTMHTLQEWYADFSNQGLMGQIYNETVSNSSEIRSAGKSKLYFLLYHHEANPNSPTAKFLRDLIPNPEKLFNPDGSRVLAEWRIIGEKIIGLTKRIESDVVAVHNAVGQPETPLQEKAISIDKINDAFLEKYGDGSHESSISEGVRYSAMKKGIPSKEMSNPVQLPPEKPTIKEIRANKLSTAIRDIQGLNPEIKVKVVSPYQVTISMSSKEKSDIISLKRIQNKELKRIYDFCGSHFSNPDGSVKADILYELNRGELTYSQFVEKMKSVHHLDVSLEGGISKEHFDAYRSANNALASKYQAIMARTDESLLNVNFKEYPLYAISDIIARAMKKISGSNERVNVPLVEMMGTAEEVGRNLSDNKKALSPAFQKNAVFGLVANLKNVELLAQNNWMQRMGVNTAATSYKVLGGVAMGVVVDVSVGAVVAGLKGEEFNYNQAAIDGGFGWGQFTLSESLGNKLAGIKNGSHSLTAFAMLPGMIRGLASLDKNMLEQRLILHYLDANIDRMRDANIKNKSGHVRSEDYYRRVAMEEILVNVFDMKQWAPSNYQKMTEAQKVDALSVLISNRTKGWDKNRAEALLKSIDMKSKMVINMDAFSLDKHELSMTNAEFLVGLELIPPESIKRSVSDVELYKLLRPYCIKNNMPFSKDWVQVLRTTVQSGLLKEKIIQQLSEKHPNFLSSNDFKSWYKTRQNDPVFNMLIRNEIKESKRLSSTTKGTILVDGALSFGAFIAGSNMVSSCMQRLASRGPAMAGDITRSLMSGKLKLGGSTMTLIAGALFATIYKDAISPYLKEPIANDKSVEVLANQAAALAAVLPSTYANQVTKSIYENLGVENMYVRTGVDAITGNIVDATGVRFARQAIRSITMRYAAKIGARLTAEAKLPVVGEALMIVELVGQIANKSTTIGRDLAGYSEYDKNVEARAAIEWRMFAEGMDVKKESFGDWLSNKVALYADKFNKFLAPDGADWLAASDYWKNIVRQKDRALRQNILNTIQSVLIKNAQAQPPKKANDLRIDCGTNEPLSITQLLALVEQLGIETASLHEKDSRMYKRIKYIIFDKESRSLSTSLQADYFNRAPFFRQSEPLGVRFPASFPSNKR